MPTLTELLALAEAYGPGAVLPIVALTLWWQASRKMQGGAQANTGLTEGDKLWIITTVVHPLVDRIDNLKR